VTQPDWSVRQARSIGAEVKRHRLRRGLTAQELADRTAELGHPITRNALANLESNRRDIVTTADLLVLARALSVPAVALLCPPGQPAVEVLPGVEVSPWSAIKWFTGEDPTLGDGWPAVYELPDPLATEDGIVGLLHLHDSYVRTWLRNSEIVEADASGAADAIRPELVSGAWAAMDIAKESLRALRRQMRGLGASPPPLRPELAAMLGEAGAT